MDAEILPTEPQEPARRFCLGVTAENLAYRVDVLFSYKQRTLTGRTYKFLAIRRKC